MLPMLKYLQHQMHARYHRERHHQLHARYHRDVITNLESSVSRKLFQVNANLVGHLIPSSKDNLVNSNPFLLYKQLKSDISLTSTSNLQYHIDKHFTISHNHQTLRYHLAGFSILLQTHFYSILYDNEKFYKYDGMRTPTTEAWDCDNFLGTLNTVFYLLHFSD